MVLATFGGEGLASVIDVDVSTLVTVSVADSSIATLDSDFRLHGLAAGSTTLSVSSAPTLSVQSSVTVGDTALELSNPNTNPNPNPNPNPSPNPDPKQVSDAPVELSELQVLLVTGVAWATAAPAAVALMPASASFGVVMQLEQQLASEGDAAEVYVYATFTDGATQQVPTTEVVLASNVAGVVAEVVNLGASQVATMTVAPGAAAYVGDVLTATWRVGTETLGSGVGWANLTLPLPVLVVASAAESRVAPPDDSAATAPISLATSFAVSAVVHYDDGTSTDFSSDSRLNVSLAAASAACASMQGPVQVVLVANATCASIEVLVSVPALSSSLNATVTVPVVVLQQLQLSTKPFPSYSGSSAHTNVPLYRLDCTSYYQHATARVMAVLSDASQVTVTSQSSFSSSNAAVVSADSSRLRSLSAGTSTLEATFDGNEVSRSVTVSDTPVSMTASVLSAGGASSSYSFTATRGLAVQAAVALTFDDGTRFSDATNAGALNWFALSTLLNFSSAVPSKVTVDGAGKLTLLENHPSMVDVTVASMCSSLVDVLPVAANLYPALGDVDLGSSSGLQFQQSGSTLSVPVRVNMAGCTLLAFQVEVNFDYNVLGATGAAAADWPALTSTLNDPVDEALFLGDDLQSSVGHGLVQLATLTLEIKQSAVTLLSGTVKVVTYVQGGQTYSIEEAAIDAGHGYAEVSMGILRARALGTVAPPRALRRRPARRLSECDGCSAGVLGDINGDCTFNANDVLEAARVYVGIVDYDALCAWKQQQLDQTLDGSFALGDVNYLRLEP